MAKAKETTETKSKKSDMVKLIWRHTKAPEGTVRVFYGVECVAGPDGLFYAEVSEAKAELELGRENQFLFEKV